MSAEANEIEQLALMALLRVDGFGPIRSRQLVDHVGSARGVWESDRTAFDALSGVDGKALVNRLDAFRRVAFDEAEQQFRICNERNIRILSLWDADYPPMLKACADAPLVLYVRGRLPTPGGRVVSVIGTRQATSYGLSAAARIIEVLAACGATIVSGLAYGIDIQAHRQALAHSAPTIGVLGSGHGSVYPSLHRKEARQMIESGGALISEYDHNSGPDREHFPQRNRIIAGLAEATIVVEAGPEGGAWITARLANDYDREVLAVPGHWEHRYSQGCHQLISRHLAALLPSPESIPQLLGWDEQPQAEVRLFPPESQEVALALSASRDPMHFDELANVLGAAPAQLQALLLELELKQLVQMLPGRYVKMQGRLAR
mgnify:CR=1 FL=1